PRGRMAAPRPSGRMDRPINCATWARRRRLYWAPAIHHTRKATATANAIWSAPTPLPPRASVDVRPVLDQVELLQLPVLPGRQFRQRVRQQAQPDGGVHQRDPDQLAEE